MSRFPLCRQGRCALRLKRVMPAVGRAGSIAGGSGRFRVAGVRRLAMSAWPPVPRVLPGRAATSVSTPRRVQRCSRRYLPARARTRTRRVRCRRASRRRVRSISTGIYSTSRTTRASTCCACGVAVRMRRSSSTSYATSAGLWSGRISCMPARCTPTTNPISWRAPRAKPMRR